MSTAMNDLVADITNRIANGVAPWRATWSSGQAVEPLRADGNRFTGVNAMLLSMAGFNRGYTSPYWFTFKQALALDACVRKGERGTPALLYKPFNSANDNDDDGHDGGAPAARGRAYAASYTVFNASQIDGLDAKHLVTPPAPRWTEGELPAAIAAYPANIVYGLQHHPCYRDVQDTIFMPPADQFETFADYCATLAHEQLHHTGAANRLNRPSLENYHKDLEARATEELIAELGSYFLTLRCGVPYSEALIDNHAAYLAYWSSVAAKTPNALVSAAAAAQRAVDYLLAQAEAATLPMAA